MGWQIVTAPVDADANIDKRVQALALKSGGGRESRNCRCQPRLRGRTRRFGIAGLLRHRAHSRPLGGGVALGGSPKGAIDTNRIFAVNFTNTPVLWASNGANDSDCANRLKLAGMNIEWRYLHGAQ